MPSGWRAWTQMSAAFREQGSTLYVPEAARRED